MMITMIMIMNDDSDDGDKDDGDDDDDDDDNNDDDNYDNETVLQCCISRSVPDSIAEFSTMVQPAMVMNPFE